MAPQWSGARLDPDRPNHHGLLWEADGRPQGLDRLHWRQAEQEILARIANGSLSGDSARAGA